MYSSTTIASDRDQLTTFHQKSVVFYALYIVHINNIAPIAAQKKAREAPTLAQISQYPLMRLKTGFPRRDIEDHFFMVAGVSPCNEMECDSPAMLRSFARQGLGLALIPAITWEMAENEKVRILPIQDPCGRYINVHLNKEGRSKVSHVFFDYVVQFFEKKAAREKHIQGIV